MHAKCFAVLTAVLLITPVAAIIPAVTSIAEGLTGAVPAGVHLWAS